MRLRRALLIGGVSGALFAVAMMVVSAVIPDVPKYLWVRWVFLPSGAVSMWLARGNPDTFEGVALIGAFVGAPIAWALIGMVLGCVWQSSRAAICALSRPDR